MHGIFFDGTSYFVDSIDFEKDENTILIASYTNIDVANDYCDTLNSEINN